MRQSPVQAGERLRKKKAESWGRQRILWRFTLTGSHPRLPSSIAALRSNSSPSRWRPARESRRGGRGWSSSQTPLPRAPWKTPLARLRPPRSRRRWAPSRVRTGTGAGSRPSARAPGAFPAWAPAPPACTGPMADLPGDPARQDLPPRSLRSRGRSVSNSSYGAGVSARLSFRPCEFLLHVV